MSEHTPGPWEWWTSCSWRRLYSVPNAASRQPCVLMPCTHNDGQADIIVSEADMRLIAAAPDLLEALTETIKLADRNLRDKFNGRTPECQALYEKCVAAITKATGQGSGA